MLPLNIRDMFIKHGHIELSSIYLKELWNRQGHVLYTRLFPRGWVMNINEKEALAVVFVCLVVTLTFDVSRLK